DKTSTPATLTVTLKPTVFAGSVTALTKGEGVILTYAFAGTATLTIASGSAAAVVNRGSTVDYPLADTTYTLAVTNHGALKTSQVAVSVKTYIPKHLYLLNVYPAQTPPAPADSIAHY